MLTKDVSEELKSVLEGLQAQGKEPTVALVKARMSTSVPMPALITTIKSWKSANRVPKVEVATQEEPALDRVSQLEKQILELTTRVATLEAKLTEQ
ncbi:hypothetical protein AB4516_05200 [Vibrio sp. 10N.222.54.F12]|uniref:KfrA N-terminal DNA-binding domain-containing protein n=3 Tax=Vibrio TaxID=662 RepID=A0A2N7I4E4_9VIBR|nr:MULTISPECIES: hypothetical protein [Vibrio]EAQ53490.1 hypothetical protein MED222_21094 [Vibrio sp. MED222]OEF57816.1 hypothetical protein A163_13820 [Vibrio tasmaniensis 1F-267]OEF66052.1 hypothetical protein A152_21425 [Vibrio tasmaniensis 1F-187]PML18043.1 hypothetical protein BCT83_05770 [Vibrio tasmaniensis]PML48538.1 hypothetical protein BCT76_10750 [Vibrio tasmaniensis]